MNGHGYVTPNARFASGVNARTITEAAATIRDISSRLAAVTVERDEARRYGGEVRIRERRTEDLRAQASDRATAAEAERDEARDECNAGALRSDAFWKPRLDAAEAERDALRAALEPFATCIDKIAPGEDIAHWPLLIDASHGLTVADVLRARAALAAGGKR